MPIEELVALVFPSGNDAHVEEFLNNMCSPDAA
jgi:hypothetical protein